MSKYRRRLEIIAGVLYAANKGAKKTRIMYIANLSHSLLVKYLDKTVAIGFIRANSDGYCVTARGQAFLEKYSDLSSKYSRIESELQSMTFEREILEKMCESPSNGNGSTGSKSRACVARRRAA